MVKKHIVYMECWWDTTKLWSFNRPRRQDFEGLLVENGAVYATTKAAFF
jgi:CMP-N-acetylneuraminic acid synthetase